jgi:hypothetical protein
VSARLLLKQFKNKIKASGISRWTDYLEREGAITRIQYDCFRCAICGKEISPLQWGGHFAQKNDEGHQKYVHSYDDLLRYCLVEILNQSGMRLKEEKTYIMGQSVGLWARSENLYGAERLMQYIEVK